MEQRESFMMLLMVAVLILLTGLFFINKRHNEDKPSLVLEDVSRVSEDEVAQPNPQDAITDSVRRALATKKVSTSSTSDEVGTIAALLKATGLAGNQADSLIESDGESTYYIETPGQVLGERDADIVMTTYIDLDDPFGQNFHETLKEVKLEYGDDKVAIVYKHFPIEQLHPNAPTLAEASECVAEQSELSFWVFVNLIFTQRQVNGQTDLNNLPTYVKNMGLSLPQYEACMQSGMYRPLIEAQINEAIALGAKGTPFTAITITGSEKVGVINGAQQIEQVRKTLDDLILQTAAIQ